MLKKLTSMERCGNLASDIGYRLHHRPDVSNEFGCLSQDVLGGTVLQYSRGIYKVEPTESISIRKRAFITYIHPLL